VGKGAIVLFGAAARLGVILAELGLVNMRVVHHLHVVVCETALFILATILVALDTVIPNLKRREVKEHEYQQFLKGF